MYSHIFKPESIFSKKFLNEWSKYYTTDVAFLKDSQAFYKGYVNQYDGDLKAQVTMTAGDNEVTIDPHDIFEKIDKLWIDIAGDKNFKQRFNFFFQHGNLDIHFSQHNDKRYQRQQHGPTLCQCLEKFHD